ncbi:MAG TPA: type II secretion system protein GspL [Xanthomonadales bacterium]|nr:type II secretion system protein GspL [Xanthomonadales bacterium]
MSARLLIRRRAAGEPLEWATEDERGRGLAGPSHGHAPPSDAIEGAREIVVFAPAEDCVLLSANVPARSREQLERALPFALEEQCAEPVEQLHFGSVPHPSGNGQLVACMARARVRELLADLAQRGVRPDLLVPEALALPPEPGRASALVEADRVVVRTALDRAFVAPYDELPQWLDACDIVRDASGRVAVTVHSDLEGDTAFLGLGISALPALDEAPAMRVLSRGLRASPTLNLLTGEFAPAHRAAPAKRLWSVAARMAVALVVLALAWVLLDRWRLERGYDAVREEMAAIHRDVYPGARVPPDPAARMRADLRAAGLGRRDDALELVARVAPVLGATQQNTLKALEYRNGTLELTLLAPGVAALDAVRESLANLPGIQAELASASAVPQGAEGRVRVRSRAP